MTGHATRVDGGAVEMALAGGLTLRATANGAITAGDAVEAYVRPETIALARDAGELPAAAQRLSGRVESLLFDGANSAVLVREEKTGSEIRIALPQTGRFADLVANETIAFGFDPLQAVCFRAVDHGG
jgi:spermidine/putrescine transport system ATP-binding protein